jgi:protein SERAC1
MPRRFPVLSRNPRSDANADSLGIEIQRYDDEDCPLGIKILREHAKAIVDIVFVHGLTGDRERTWHSVPDRRHPNGVLWPKELLPHSIPESRILTFGYDAYIVRSGQVPNNRIRDHARDLVNELARARVSVEERIRPIIFVVHSLGGIVCKDALQISTLTAEPHLQCIARLTRAILFVATPHEGSSIAQWASIPASTLGVIKPTNVDLLAVLQTSSEVRDRI